MNDLKFACRQLLKYPGFTAVAVLTLALGIGAATAVFSLVNAILLNSLPVPYPQELRVLQWTGVDARPRSISGYFKASGNRAVAECVSPTVFASVRERCAELADVFAFAPLDDAVVRSRTEACSTDGMVVSDNFFSALGVRPVVGRLFEPGETGPDATLEVVIAFDQWGRLFAHDPAAIGESLTLNGHMVTIIGVLPYGFTGVRPGNPDGFFVLMTRDSPFQERAVSVADHWWVRLMARMRPGTSDTHFKAALDTVFVSEAGSVMSQPEMLVQPGGGGLAFDRQAYGQPLLLLLAVVGLVLLVACANIAGLLLARGTWRQHELAVRAALGAGRGRLIRQSLAETLLLALPGAGLGVLIGIQGGDAVSRLLGQSTEGLHYDLSLNLMVLGFSIATALAVALLAGLLPALRAGNASPLNSLKSRTVLGTPRLRSGQALVVAQIGISLVLLSGAGLFLRTLINLGQIDAGFDTQKLLVFQLNAGFAGYEDAQLTAYYDRVQVALGSIPGVRSAALTFVPLLDNKSSSGGFAFRSRPMEPSENPQAYRLVVGETFFDTLGLRLLHGRGLSPADTDGTFGAVVVNETFARKYFADQDPLGHTINTWRTDWRIVGVCADAKYQNIREPVPPTIYIPFRQFPPRLGAFFLVRTVLPSTSLTTAVRTALAEIDPGVPVAHLTTQEQLIAGTINRERLLAALCTALAGFALILCCIGLYGLLSFNVARRAGEIGVRMALGAQRGQVARKIIHEALTLAAIGIGIGLPMALGVNRLVRSQLYGVQPADPATLVIVTITLGMVAALSAWLPAWRAGKVDPMEALRSE
jgi:predicted permease